VIQDIVVKKSPSDRYHIGIVMQVSVHDEQRLKTALDELVDDYVLYLASSVRLDIALQKLQKEGDEIIKQWKK
jgi:hypothetical protein